MEMNYQMGSIIKMKRMELNMSQEQLAEGICASSYLSRIENNKLIPDDEIYRLLLERLGLNYDELLKGDDSIDDEIERWYQELLNWSYTNLIEEKAMNWDIEGMKERAELARAETGMKFNVVYCRYLLLTSKIQEAETLLQQLSQVVPHDASRVFFLYINVVMVEALIKGDYKRTIYAGNELMKIKGFDELGSNEEVGVFYYNLALAHQHLNRFRKAAEYCEEALVIFSNNYFLERALSTLLLRGICLNNLRQWTETKRSYDLAERILKYLPEKVHPYFRSKINNNRGVCMQNQNKYEVAIAYYLSAMDELQGINQIIPMTNVIYCYYELGDKPKAKEWLERANDYVKRHSIPQCYYLQLEIFSTLLENESPSIQAIEDIQVRSMNYFSEHQLLTQTVRFAKLFARFYESKHHYKKANEMYRIIQFAETKMYEGR